MGSIESLLAEVDELALARNVAIPHDEARMNYSPGRNTVGSFDEFTDLIADYYNYHIGQCVIHGGFLSRTEAAGKVKKILEQEYRRQGGNTITAYNDAHDGTNGGLRVVLDRIAEHLKAESVELYIRDAFDRYICGTKFLGAESRHHAPIPLPFWSSPFLFHPGGSAGRICLQL